MSQSKYISTKETVQLTGLSTEEIYDLIHSGRLSAHKAPKSGWRISLQDLVELGLIQEEQDSISEGTQTEDGFTYVADEEHYTEVFRRMTEVKRSLKITTGDLKNFNATIERDGEEEKLCLCDFFLSLVERGVHVQVVCMKPFGFYLYAKRNCPLLLEHPLFELRYNGHNHMKIFIFDDECAYIGSANITSAAIGKRASGNRNYEAGMLMWGESMTQAPKQHFDRVWNNPESLKHGWKRFAKMAKEMEKKLREKYGE
ncbi:MAG: helix-turn-helix domain-containing protein [Prevotella sp.]|nr:helix-turn-helix domain-containing protein [Prevotella sp.]